MYNITITEMTPELAYEMNDGFENDPLTCPDGDEFHPFIYSKKWVDEYLEKQKSLNHVLFAIMLYDIPIGEVKLYNISKRQNKCEISIHIKNDTYKNQGYGTEAGRLALKYAKDTLGVNIVEARTITKNKRSQRVLKKLSFTEYYREDQHIHFELDFNRDYTVRPIEVVPMTERLFHEFYKGYSHDLPPKGHRYYYKQYVYDKNRVDKIYKTKETDDRVILAIMIDDAPIGKIELIDIRPEKGVCRIDCDMQSKNYKNMGYGKNGIIEALKLAKSVLGLKKVRADINAYNTHAKHVFEKIGFTQNCEISLLAYYEINL